MLLQQAPIGIFDSGIGGLTVARAIANLLPGESILYVGDTAHLPYGEKSPEAVQHYALRITTFLLNQSCKALVIACNTASALAYLQVARLVNGRIPVINVIDPIVAAVAADAALHKVGIIGTRATIRSHVYDQKLKQLRPDIETVSLATALLASMIEEGFYNNQVSRTIIENYLRYPDFMDIDALILACTHYPLIRAEVEQFFQHSVKVFDSTGPVAQQLAQQLAMRRQLAPPGDANHRFYVTDYTESFEKTTQLFFGRAVHLEPLPLWD
ncbi:MAG: glutamate racemase [Chitinophagales bacterium]|nr:glutamate racemase [Chitinophagales bacterium]MDW8428641.1 glutamate racemase [Chitinophagales bacterium]